MHISTTDRKSQEYKVQMRMFRRLARRNTENVGTGKKVEIRAQVTARRTVIENVVKRCV